MKTFGFFIFLYFVVVHVGHGQTLDRRINLDHLLRLTERVEIGGDSMDIVHIYSDYPSYNWVGAAESGEEGIACVDDAARAALLYLRYYEVTKDTTLLLKAKPLIRFVRYMETEDGMFYNFLRADHSVNEEGRTSFKSFGWWGVRGLWCLSAGYRVFKTKDSAFARTLNNGIQKTFPHIDSLLQLYHTFRKIKNIRIPRWLLYESGADVTSVLMMALSEYYAVSQEPRIKTYLLKFANGLIAMQDGNMKVFPYGLHRSWETMWHMWGNDQTTALAAAGKLLHNRHMIASAELEAQGFFSRLLIEGFRKEIDISSDSTKVFEQIAYSVRPMVSGLLRLFDATRNPKYTTMAGLAASWFSGNNAAHQVMYDTTSGICFDGIRDSVSINKNSGAESTIEALWTLVELESYPHARVYLDANKILQEKKKRFEFAVFKTSMGKEASAVLDIRKGAFHLFEGAESVSFRRKNSPR